MNVVVANHSSYPRIGDRPGQQRLRRAHAARERGEISPAELTAAERAVIDEVIHEQEDAGVEVVTDGQIRWSDPIAHMMDAFDGVRTNGLLRYFDTNFYYRQPVIRAGVRRRTAIALHDFTMACRAARRAVKPVLTGPYTLARLCLIESGPYTDAAALAHALSEALVQEIEDLVHAGAQTIQIEEPAILAYPGDIRLLRTLLEPLWAARGGAQLVVATYFGDAEPLYAQLNSLPADVLALDMTYSPRLAETIAATGASKVLGLGVVDGRTTRMEDAAAVSRRVETLLHRYALDTVHLLPSCGLEYLPRSHARAKLELLTRTKQLLSGST